MASAEYPKPCSKTTAFNAFIKDASNVTTFQTTTFDNKNVAFVGTLIGRNVNLYLPFPLKNQWDKLEKKLYNTWKCQLCKERMKTYKCYIDTHGMVACRSDIEVDKYIMSAKTTVTSMNTVIKKLPNSNAYDLWSLLPVTSDLVHPEVSGQSADESESFKHFHLTYDALTDEEVNVSDLTKAFRRYVPAIKILLNKITPSLRNTLTAFKSILEVETYAKVLIPGTDWLLMICKLMKKEFYKMSIFEQMQLLGDIICKSRISEDDNNDVVITDYHQANKSILTLLEIGTLRGIDKMKMELVSKWGSPSTYQRRTKEPTLKMAQIAMGQLKDFTNTIHTTAEIETHADTVKITKKPEGPTSSMEAFAQMGKKKQCNKYDFLSAQPKDASFVEPSNIRELLDKIKSGEIHSLKISTSLLKPCYSASTDIDRSNIIYDHLWNFLNYETGIRRFGYSDQEVTHIKHIKTFMHDNIIFIVKGSRYTRPKITDNCCFPEFLSTKCKRTSGPAYERLNKTLPINIPDTGELAIGLGTSVKDTKNELMLHVEVYINGSKTPTKITHF